MLYFGEHVPAEMSCEKEATIATDRVVRYSVLYLRGRPTSHWFPEAARQALQGSALDNQLIRNLLTLDNKA